LGVEVMQEATKLEKQGLDIDPAVAPLGPDVGQLREKMDRAAREQAEQIKREREQALREQQQAQNRSRSRGPDRGGMGM